MAFVMAVRLALLIATASATQHSSTSFEEPAVWTSAQQAAGMNIVPEPSFFEKGHAREGTNTDIPSDASHQPSRRSMIIAMHDYALLPEIQLQRLLRFVHPVAAALSPFYGSSRWDMEHSEPALSFHPPLSLKRAHTNCNDQYRTPPSKHTTLLFIYFSAGALTLLPEIAFLSMLAVTLPVESGNADCGVSQSTDNLVIRFLPSLCHFSYFTSLFAPAALVCPVSADLWHRALGLAIVGIMIAAMWLVIKALLGLSHDGCNRRCVPSMHESSAVSSGIQGHSFCARESQMQSARDGKFDRMSRLMLGNQISTYVDRFSVFMASTAAPVPVISRLRWTFLRLSKHHIASSARKTACAVFASQLPVVPVMLLLSLLPLSMATDPTCANLLLGQARNNLAAASLSSGLVFFAGGFIEGVQKFV